MRGEDTRSRLKDRDRDTSMHANTYAQTTIVFMANNNLHRMRLVLALVLVMALLQLVADVCIK